MPILRIREDSEESSTFTKKKNGGLPSRGLYYATTRYDEATTRYGVGSGLTLPRVLVLARVVSGSAYAGGYSAV
jgi:hypothetical protein